MRLLITAGPTREHFDPVRFISNGSTGQLGCAIADEAHKRGHQVSLVLGPVAIAPVPGVRTTRVVSAEDMLAACLSCFPSCQAAIMTAAVADWRPVERHATKAPKSSGNWSIQLEPTPDICATLGQQKGSRVLMGFALQDTEAQARAEEKLVRKNCDFIVLTSPAAIGQDVARLQVKPRSGPWLPPLETSKRMLASSLLDLVEQAVGATGA